MSKRKHHRVKVAKRNLYGARRWWATCTCGGFYQGCFDKNEAQRLADGHRAKVMERNELAEDG
jgi:hypothetical protein